ncbi:dephospho-CoA kinase [Aestuariivirga sp. YIM B02566]|uniref:Dephospho-CoA kinase n=1 Tax=Taklimakanibacter albus TaxID=2800327 RepID=A0ACC5QX01_9HYPH|nr:dephospho-CoA kinase [Aestuariivirga sp. YIM B02566]MBK1864773.1 dephospho-CoA kinase [Aestuariivirga sp. YIM B02566]
MIVIGLTGSIGMGKTATARMFAEEGVPVADSDAVVHQLYEKGGAAVAPIADAFPAVITDGAIDRQKLARHLAGHPDDFKKIEAIVHPLVRAEQENFLSQARRRKAPLAVLDIPLLFETGRYRDVDKIVVVSAPEAVQRERVLARPGMTEEKFASILARQLPDAEKRARADFIVDSDRGFDHARAQVRRIIAELKPE